MGATSKSLAADTIDNHKAALDERIDDIIAMHDGDWRAALETLLIVADARAETISFGYVRGCAPGQSLFSE